MVTEPNLELVENKIDPLLNSVINIIAGHEFRTPMNGIIGTAQLIQMEINNGESSLLKQYTDMMLISARRLMSLSNRLLTWYTLFSNPDKVFTTCLISSMEIESILSEQNNLNISKKAFFLFQSGCNEFTIRGTKDILIHSLTELINNAFKFSECEKLVSVNITTGINSVYISIINYCNELIPAEELNRRKVFFQYNRELFEQQGIGLGIEIAKLGIEKCGGSFYLTNANTGSNNRIICEIVLSLA